MTEEQWLEQGQESSDQGAVAESIYVGAVVSEQRWLAVGEEQ